MAETMGGSCCISPVRAGRALLSCSSVMAEGSDSLRVSPSISWVEVVRPSWMVPL